ncbi:unnamed protein product, partial [Polarella glacialis]
SQQIPSWSAQLADRRLTRQQLIVFHRQSVLQRLTGDRRKPFRFTDPGTLQIVTHDLCHAELWSESLALISEAFKQGLEAKLWPSITQTIVTSLSKGAQWQKVMTLVRGDDRISDRGLELAAGALTDAKKWREAIALIETMRESGQRLALPMLTAALPNLGRGDPWLGALNFLRTVRHFRLVADAVAFAECVQNCGRSTRWAPVLQLLAVMRQESGPPTDWVLATAIDACSPAGEENAKKKSWHWAVRLFNQGRSWEIPPGEESLRRVVGVLTPRRRLWRQVLAVMQVFEAEKVVVPNKIRRRAGVIAARRGAYRRRWEEATLAAGGLPEPWQQAMQDLARARSGESSKPVLEALRAAATSCADATQWEIATQLSRELTLKVDKLENQIW